MEEQKAVTESAVETNENPTLLGTEEVAEEGSLLSEGSEEGVEKSEGESSTEEAKEVVVPEKYEIKLAEGMEVDNVLMEKITPILKKYKLNNEAVQELANIYTPHIQEMAKAGQKEALDFHNQQKEEWKKESVKFLGANSKEELSNSAKFINTFSSSKEEAQTIREMLEVSGLGNYLPIIKMFSNAGKKLRQDSFAEPNKRSTIDAEKSPEKYLYTSMSP